MSPESQESKAYRLGLRDRILRLNGLSLIGFSFFLLVDMLLTLGTDVHASYYGLFRLGAIVAILGGNHLLRHWLSSRTLGLFLLLAYYAGFILYPLLPLPLRMVENFFLLYLLLLVIGLLPFLVFHVKEDKAIMVFSCIFILLSAGMSSRLVFLRMNADEQAEMSTYLSENPLVWLTYFAAMGLLVFVLYRYRRHNYLLRSRLSETNAAVKEKIKEIKRSSQELISQQERLLDLQLELSDMQENLESMIEERTEGLKSRQQVLIHYGFMNSHLLRAPIARLMGLLQVLGLDLPHSEKEEVGKLVSASIDEIDKVSLTINEALQNPDNNDKLAEVERRVSQLYGTSLD